MILDFMACYDSVTSDPTLKSPYSTDVLYSLKPSYVWKLGIIRMIGFPPLYIKNTCTCKLKWYRCTAACKTSGTVT